MDEALAALDALWGVVGQWQAAYTGWRETRFRDIKVRFMPHGSRERATQPLPWRRRNSGVALSSEQALELDLKAEIQARCHRCS